MNIKSSLLVVSAAVLVAIAAPSALAVTGDVYKSSAFQGLTFTFTETDADTLKFNISGTPGGDWATAQYLGAFDFKDIGLNFNTVTAIANGPGAVNLHGVNVQLNGSGPADCVANGSPSGSICFDISPDVAIGASPINLTYTIDFSSPLNIADSGPHLQLAFTAVQGGNKVGSLYSQNIAQSSTSSTSSTSSSTIPEPNSAPLAALALGLLALGFKSRKKA